MLLASALGALARSPLGSGESLTSLLRFDVALVGRCGRPEDLWAELRPALHASRYSRTGAGRAFLDATPLARTARAVAARSRVLGRPLLDLFDLLGSETVVAGARMPEGHLATLVLSRLGPKANALLGLYAARTRKAPLRTASGRWWIRRHGGRAWTKIGDVLAISEDPRLLARFVGSLQGPEREPCSLVGLLSDGATPELAVALPERGADEQGGLLRACVVSLRLGQPSAAVPTYGRRHPAPIVRGDLYLPVDAYAGAVWDVDAPALWRLLLRLFPGDQREELIRYVEDHLCAVFEVDDFERDVLSRFTGLGMAVCTRSPDRWLALAGGGEAPTLAVLIRVRTDPFFEERLQFALAEAAGAFIDTAPSFAARVFEEEHQGRRLTVLRVGAEDGRTEADAGYFVARKRAEPGYGLLVASTSADWLRRAINADDGAVPSLPARTWFRGLPQRDGKDAFGSLLVGAVDDCVSKSQPPGELPRRLAPWLGLVGTVILDGVGVEEGVLRLRIRIPGSQMKSG